MGHTGRPHGSHDSGVTLEQLRRHRPNRDERPPSADSAPSTALWIAIHGSVYDVTHFADFHPGGKRLIEEFSGKDASDAFDRHHAHVPVEEAIGDLKIGPLVAETVGPALPVNAEDTRLPDDKADRANDDDDAYRAVYVQIAEGSHDGRTVTREALEAFFRSLDPSCVAGMMAKVEPGAANVPYELFKKLVDGRS